ncbi:hypothetical protein ACVWXQ_000968 [Bradyrhizobium sp. S3.14.4]
MSGRHSTDKSESTPLKIESQSLLNNFNREVHQSTCRFHDCGQDLVRNHFVRHSCERFIQATTPSHPELSVHMNNVYAGIYGTDEIDILRSRPAMKRKQRPSGLA